MDGYMYVKALVDSDCVCRLGTGSNRTCSVPVRVSVWPPSVGFFRLLAVSCGAAHSLALAARPAKPCLANPWGLETAVLAWGFGSNGQLGDGHTEDRFEPVRVRLPRGWGPVKEVCAGRSWSLALSFSGRLLSWGRGWRGQLGQGDRRFSRVPRPCASPAAPLQVRLGYLDLTASPDTRS